MSSTAAPTTTYAPMTTNGTTLSFIPMVTPFTAPQACSSFYVGNSAGGSNSSASYEINAWSGLFQLSHNLSTTCYPTEYISYLQFESSTVDDLIAGTPANSLKTVEVLAPFACPGGWQVATTSVTASTTWTACCPSDYGVSYSLGDDGDAFWLSGGFGCLSTVSDAATLTYAAETHETTGGSTHTTITMLTTTVQSAQNLAVTADSIYGLNIRDTHKTSGLSTGAKAGIGAGVAVGGIIIICILVFWCLRRRKQKNVPQIDTTGERMGADNNNPQDYALSPQSEVAGAGWSQELASSQKVELPGDGKGHQVELPGDEKGYQAELPGDGRRQELADHHQYAELAGWGPQELDGSVVQTAKGKD